MATRMSMKLADYTVTEAGFGADLGAEKFLDIKCRIAGIKPSAVVWVATVRAVSYTHLGEWMRTWEETCRDDGADLACESVICYEAPDSEGEEACINLGKALA